MIVQMVESMDWSFKEKFKTVNYRRLLLNIKYLKIKIKQKIVKRFKFKINQKSVKMIQN